MTKRTQMNRRKHLLFAVIVALASGILVVMKDDRVLSQSNEDPVEYNAVYDCGAGKSKFRVVSCEGVEDMDRCKVQTLSEFAANGISDEDNWYRKTVMNHLAAGCKPKNRPQRQPAEENKKDPPPNDTAAEPRTARGPAANPRKFKAGDRVMASPGLMTEDKSYQPCTVVKEMKPNSYYLLCDPHNGLSFIEQTVREDFVRAQDNATAAPKIECLLNEPPGTVTKTSPASAALFQRMIYEKAAAENHRTKVGVTFDTWQMARPLKNVLNRGNLLYDFLPLGTTVYPIKTRFVTCVQGKEFNYRRVIETCYACSRDEFGDWTCGPSCGAPKILERHNVPNLSHFFGPIATAHGLHPSQTYWMRQPNGQ